ncbi:hypothetical protein EN846_34285, partial [Mesorhizobium sp. M4B.F.Ca.ET.203.01.1.1]
MDASLTHWINSAAGISPLLDTTMIAISQIGVPLMVLAVAVQWWSKADRYHVRHACLSAGLSFLLGLAINQAILRDQLEQLGCRAVVASDGNEALG